MGARAPEYPHGGCANEGEGRQHNEAGGEGEDALLDGDLREPGHVGRHERHQQVERAGGRHEPADAADGRDDQALGQQLPQQTRGAAAHRGADRELLLAPGVAGQRLATLTQAIRRTKLPPW